MPIAQVSVSAANVSPASDGARDESDLRPLQAGEDAAEHDRAGDQADLALECPLLGATTHLAAAVVPGLHAAVQHVHVGHSRRSQPLLGLAGAVARAADDHDRHLQVALQLV